MLAAITVDSLVGLFVTVLIVGGIFWLLWWLVSYFAPPEPFAKVLRGLLALVAVLFLIDILLGLLGHGQFIRLDSRL